MFIGALYAFQRPFRQYPGVEYFNFELTPDWQQKGEWTFARLMFPPGPNDGYAGRFDGDFRQGLVAVDAGLSARRPALLAGRPPADALAGAFRGAAGPARRRRRRLQLAMALRGASGRMGLDARRRRKILREYLLRGGFFMADDFHGDYEWEMFLKRIRYVFPDRPIVDIPDSDPIFHTVFDSEGSLPDSRAPRTSTRLQELQ